MACMVCTYVRLMVGPHFCYLVIKLSSSANMMALSYVAKEMLQDLLDALL